MARQRSAGCTGSWAEGWRTMGVPGDRWGLSARCGTRDGWPQIKNGNCFPEQFFWGSGGCETIGCDLVPLLPVPGESPGPETDTVSVSGQYQRGA